MNLIGPNLPPRLLVIYKVVLFVTICVIFPVLLICLYSWLRYPWKKVSLEYLMNNGKYLVHLTSYKNLLNIEYLDGYKFKDILSTNSLVNTPQLLFTKEQKSAVWFFLDIPNSDQAFSAGFGRKRSPTICINIKKASNILAEKEIYIRELDNAVMIIGKDLFFPHNLACLGQKVQSRINFITQLKVFLGFKKNLL